ncbi:hypothetical protein OIU85_022100 [Salix viminalis]|uniref:Uncharacterized protein n=1 Tax=Salix viminalis TaxID=40686 RepID=A0A9Q0Z7H9_SALVM|nr:hypothetical protein OIU85_022100 [Salix viminalis]
MASKLGLLLISSAFSLLCSYHCCSASGRPLDPKMAAAATEFGPDPPYLLKPTFPLPGDEETQNTSKFHPAYVSNATSTANNTSSSSSSFSGRPRWGQFDSSFPISSLASSTQIPTFSIYSYHANNPCTPHSSFPSTVRGFRLFFTGNWK